jgi:hypothetical protein
VWRQNPNVNHSQINVKGAANPSFAGLSFPAQEVIVSEEPEECEVNDPYLVPIQPGIYTESDYFDPINATLGISYPTQFPKTVLEGRLGGNQIFYNTNTGSFCVPEREFEIIGAAPQKTPIFQPQEARNGANFARPTGPETVYDPRFVGYGADDRSYTDELLGSAKYYYDDINAVRMPSYITRNKIDSCVTPCGDRYGDLKAGYLSLSEARKGAEHSWRKNSLDFRVNLSKSLMRKKNKDVVQRRLAPKYTF